MWHGEVPFQCAGMTGDKYELLKELAEDSNYWSSAYRFIEGVKHQHLSELPIRQRNWITTIIAELDDELEKMAAVEVLEEFPDEG